MSSVETGQMSAVETGQMSAAETGQMSAVETIRMLKSQIRGWAQNHQNGLKWVENGRQASRIHPDGSHGRSGGFGTGPGAQKRRIFVLNNDGFSSFAAGYPSWMLSRPACMCWHLVGFVLPAQHHLHLPILAAGCPCIEGGGNTKD